MTAANTRPLISNPSQLDAFDITSFDDEFSEVSHDAGLTEPLDLSHIDTFTKVRQPFAAAYQSGINILLSVPKTAALAFDVATSPVSKGKGTRSLPGEVRDTPFLETRQRFHNILLEKAHAEARNLFPGDPRLQDDFMLTKAPSAIASTIGFLLLTVSSGGLGGTAAGRAMAIGGSANAIDALDRAVQEGRPTSEIANLLDSSFLIGASEGIVIPRIIERLGGDNFLTGLIHSGLENSFQEAVQRGLQNKLEGRPTFEGVGEDALLGLIGGTFAQTGGEVVVRGARTLEKRLAHTVDQALGPGIKPETRTQEDFQKVVDDAKAAIRPNADIRAKLGLILDQAETLLTPEGDIDLLGELSQSLRQEFADQAKGEFLSGVPESVISEFEAINRKIIKSREAVAKQRFALHDKIAELEQKLLDQPGSRRLRAEIQKLNDQIEALRVRPDQKFVARIRKAVAKLFDADNKAAQGELIKTLKAVNLKEIDPAQQENIETIVDTLDPAKPSDKTLERLDGTIRELAQNPDSVVPGRIVEGLRRLIKQPVRDLSAPDARILNKAIQHAVHLSEVKRGIKERLEGGQFAQDAIDISREMLSEQSILKSNPRFKSGVVQARQKDGFMRMVFSRIANTTLDTLANIVGDGDGGATHRVLAQDVIDSFDTGLDFYYEGTDARDDAIRAAGLEPDSDEVALWSAEIADTKGRLYSDLSFGRFTPSTLAQVDLFTDHNGNTVAMTAAHRMQIVAGSTDPETHDIMLFHKNKDGSRGIKMGARRVPASNEVTPSQTGATEANSETFSLNAQTLAQLKNSLSPAQLAVTGAMVGHLNGPFKQMVKKWSVDNNGVDITKDDTWFPRHRARQGVEVKEITAERFTQSAVETTGILQERTGGDAPLQVRDIFVEYSDVLYAGAMATQMGPAIRRAKTALDSVPVTEALGLSRNGSRVKSAFNRFYDAAAQQVVGRSNAGDGIGQRSAMALVNRLTRGFLALNPRVATYQTVSVMMLRSEMDNAALTQAIAEGAMFDSAVDERMNKKSAMRFRSEGSRAGRVNETSEGGAVFGGDIKSRARKEGSGFRMIGAMDNAVMRAAWVTAEIQAANEMGGDRLSPEVQKRAGEIAIKAVNRTQPTFDPLSISGIGVEAKGSILRVATMFRAQRSKNIDMTIRRLHDLVINPTASNVANVAADIATIWILNSMAIAGIQELFAFGLRLGGPTDDNEDTPLISFLRRVNQVAFGNLLLGQLFGVLSDRVLTESLESADIETVAQFPPDISPAISIVENLFSRTPARVFAAEDAQEVFLALERMAEDIAPVLGVPVTPLRMTRQVLESIDTGSAGSGGSEF